MAFEKEDFIRGKQATKSLYNQFGDDESKMIFIQKLMYSITNNKDYFFQMIQMLPKIDGKESMEPMLQFAHECESRGYKLYLFGAGYDGMRICTYIKRHHIKIEAFCDNASHLAGKLTLGTKIINKEELYQNKAKAYVIISSNRYLSEILKDLKKMHFAEDRIYFDKEYNFEAKGIYFDESIMIPHTNEVFIDAGAYYGESTGDFIEWCHGEYDRVLAFEPDELNNQILQQHYYGYKNVEIYKYGLFNEKKTLGFQTNGNQGSKISESGNSIIELVSIDEILNGDPATCIKMDVEGAEMDALKGCKFTIQKYKPRLMISVYHKPEDIWEIPVFIKQVRDDYKFYLRHYSFGSADTVLYAI